jgi:hypothetical protein
LYCASPTEESTEKKSKTSGSEAAELKRQMKNMENQHQVCTEMY